MVVAMESKPPPSQFPKAHAHEPALYFKQVILRANIKAQVLL